METEVSCDLRNFRGLFADLKKKIELARNRNMLSLLVSHTMYRNLHKYFIDLLTNHMIQYSSGYESRFPRKRPWFESQFCNTILYIFVVVVFCLL